MVNGSRPGGKSASWCEGIWFFKPGAFFWDFWYYKQMENNLMEKIVALCKRRGFIYPGSEIYGGLGGTWDYGPLGTEVKRNIKALWWRAMVLQRDDMVGIDAAIMMNPRAWEASGHVEAFTDPLIEC